MTIIFYNFFLLFFLLIPIFLITGPAIPDIIISISGIYFLIYFLLIKKNHLFLKGNLFLISIFFWSTLILVSFFAFDKTKSFQDSFIFIRLLLIPIIGYYFFFNNHKNIKILIHIIFFIVIFVLIDSLYQFFNYSSKDGFGYDLLGFKSSWYGRLTGPFGDELVPGAYVSKFGLIGYLVFLFLNKNRKIFLLEIFYLTTIGIVCFASGERMAFATYFLSLFFLFLFMHNRRLVFLNSLILSILLIFIIYKTHPFYNDFKILESTEYHQGMTIEKSFQCEDNRQKTCNRIIKIQPNFIEILKNFNTSAYGEIYILGLKMFKDNPFTGIGISNYQFACQNLPKYKNTMQNYSCASHPHNIYIQWLSEGGLITLFSFTSYLVYLFYLIITNSHRNEFKIISLAVMIIMFWPIMSTGSLIKNWNGVLTFYIIAICISINKIKIDNHD